LGSALGCGSRGLIVSNPSLSHTQNNKHSAFKLLSSLLEFDNSDEAWRRYDKMTAREL
jgi:hypothetical protein